MAAQDAKGFVSPYQESRDAQFSVGLNVQGTELESERVFPTTTSVKQNFFNLLPNAMYRKKFNAKNSVRLFYRAGDNFPSVNQLQDVYDLSNSFSVSVGNPGLKQSTTQFLGGGYTYTNSKTGTSIFANIFAQTANDYIANSTTMIEDSTYVGPNLDLLLVPGTIVNRPVNVDGYRSFRSFLTYSMPLKFQSKRRLCGMPLLHITSGIDPDTGKRREAHGFVAVGGRAHGVFAFGAVARGWFACGGVAMGLVTFGGEGIGLVSFGGLALGLLLAYGVLGIGTFAVGGLAAGYHAVGGLVLGWYGIGAMVIAHQATGLSFMQRRS